MRFFSSNVLARALFVSGLAGLVALAGCPGPTFIVQQYQGPQRPVESIATLRVNGADSVRLLTLDGEDVRAPIESDSRLHIELLPGEHRMTVANANAPDDRLDPLVWSAEAGKVYRVTVAAGVAARLWEVDRGNDHPGREIAPPAPAAPPQE